MATKIATCSYCGHRAALVLTARDGHELACSACGAPLHDLKPVRKYRKGAGIHNERPAGFGAAPHGPKQKTSSKSRRVHYEHPHDPRTTLSGRLSGKSRKKYKKKKSTARRFLGEAFDLLEDIFD